MYNAIFPVIDPAATGENIVRLRKEKGLTVRDMQRFFGFEEPQAIYKWQSGKSLPSVDNLYALGTLLQVPMEDILVPMTRQLHIANRGQQDRSCCPLDLCGRLGWIRQMSGKKAANCDACSAHFRNSRAGKPWASCFCA